jgi:hypothetical protein
MSDCLEHCSRFWGNGEGCFGIVWVGDTGACWIRNSTTSTKNLVPLENHYSALVVASQMSGYDTKCPAADASVHDLAGVEGMGYTVNCNKVISGFDGCFSGMPKPCLENPYMGYFHTSSLDECLKICVDQHPLCKGVSWSPDLAIGFANCWPKTGFADGGLQSPGQKQGTIHSATITRIDPVNNQCPEKKTYSNTEKKKDFDIHCGQTSAGSNITSIHMQNLTSCMDACASSDQKCVGVVFDSKLEGGFKNCYLQNTTNTVADMGSATYAALSSGTSSGGGSGSNDGGNNSSSTSSSSSSKAWIAGPVIGGIAAVALVAFLAFWLRKRKARAAGASAVEKDGREFGQYGPAPAYSPGAAGGAAPAGGYYDPPPSAHMAHAATPMELSGQERQANELPASTKYAAHAKDAPQELP